MKLKIGDMVIHNLVLDGPQMAVVERVLNGVPWDASHQTAYIRYVGGKYNGLTNRLGKSRLTKITKVCVMR